MPIDAKTEKKINRLVRKYKKELSRGIITLAEYMRRIDELIDIYKLKG